MRLFAHITMNDYELLIFHKSQTENLNSRNNRPLSATAVNIAQPTSVKF
jgi:hypothetical protein